jgi:dTDP-D-glucose 4,6-dehydratase
MGFLKDEMDGKTPDEEENKDPKALEETYQRLYMKIGRDFVHVDDLAEIIESIIKIIDPNEQHNIQIKQNSAVMTRAVFYKDLIDSGESERMQAFDLIDLTED